MRATWDAPRAEFSPSCSSSRAWRRRACPHNVPWPGSPQGSAAASTGGLTQLIGDKSSDTRRLGGMTCRLPGKRVGVIRNGCAWVFLLSGLFHLRAAHTLANKRAHHLCVCGGPWTALSSGDVGTSNFCRTAQWYAPRVSSKFVTVESAACAVKQVKKQVLSSAFISDQV